ncbi:MAG: methyltransferase, TIGR04325 family [Candidatus Kapabacteria bacterium]|nr:methyltransferase, TIGR04325 family [Candidatus Kapabacteria bacterium]
MIKFIKLILPPIFLDSIHRIINLIWGWHGNYPSWEMALKKSTSYSNKEIFDKVKSAALKVKNGDAFFERDSVLFYQEELNYELLTTLMLISSNSENGSLNIIDFGGSLGSTYFQNKKLLSLLPSLKWNIVEQEEFVKFGIKYLQDEHLSFYYSIKECLETNKVNVILFSSVLQYLEKPYEFLKEVLGSKIEFIIFDRTMINHNLKDRLTVQKVPPWIYKASYPCWIFDKTKLINLFNSSYDLLYEYDNKIAYIGSRVELISLVFKCKS